MSKHEKSFTPLSASDQNLDERVEAALRAFMLENDGRMPTRVELNKVVKTSNTRLGPSFYRVRDKIESMSTRLSSMPEIPVELRAASEKALEEMWAMTRDLQNQEIVELRRSQEAKDARYRADQEDVESIIRDLEREKDALAASLADCDRAAAEQATRIEALQLEVAALVARQSERDAILEMFMERAGGDKPAAARKASSRKVADDDEPELPMA